MAIVIIIIVIIIPADIKANNKSYLLKFNNKNTRKRYESVQS